MVHWIGWCLLARRWIHGCLFLREGGGAFEMRIIYLTRVPWCIVFHHVYSTLFFSSAGGYCNSLLVNTAESRAAQVRKVSDSESGAMTHNYI